MSTNKISNLITSLPTIKSLTLEDVAKINEVREAYNSLNVEEKKQISNISDLVALETQLSILKELGELIIKAQKSTTKENIKVANDLFVTLKDADVKRDLEVKIKKLEKKLKIIYFFSVGIKIAIIVSLFLIGSRYLYLSKSPPPELKSEKSKDNYLNFQKENPVFLEAVRSYESGQYEQAITLFEKSREGASTWGENAIIDFSIAEQQLALNRAEGIEKLIQISKNEDYNGETRALAMLQAYLIYLKYYDTKILSQLMGAEGIPSSIREQVELAYMKKIYNMHPFAYPIIYIIRDNLSTIKNKEEAVELYNKYSKLIDDDIEGMKNISSRSMVFTSTMLNRAGLLGRLYIQFDAVPKVEVEKAYQDLITYDQERGSKYTINKQYALIAYANFESGAKDYQKAEKILGILFSEPLDISLKESLPKNPIGSRYPYFLELFKNTKDEKVKDFINLIGSSLPKQ